MKICLLLWEVLTTDRTVWYGAGSSGTSLLGAATIDHTQVCLAIFAAFFGGLSALATFVYMCLKIHRMVKNPQHSE